MERTLGSLVVAVLVFAAFVGLRTFGKGSKGEEYKQVTLEMVSHVEGYAARPDYFVWLVEACHDDCFSDCYHRRRRGRSWVDEEKYFYNVFTSMMKRAEEDKVTHVAAALQVFRDKELTDPEAVRRRRPR